MKYLLKWRIVNPPASIEEQKKRLKENDKDIKTREDEKKYGKILFAPHQYGNFKGFVILEATEEQLINRITLTTTLDYEIVPIIPVPEMRKAIDNR